VNVRRGNTLLEIEEGKSHRKIIMGRKGLTKFFDIRIEFISEDSRYDNTILNLLSSYVKNYILAGPLKTILSGHNVEVIKTLKANGENAQVSWNPDVNAWIVASKNSGMILRSRKDLEDYKSSARY
jgi:hypothetical protein